MGDADRGPARRLDNEKPAGETAAGPALPKSLFYPSNGSFMIRYYFSQDSIKIGIPWHLTLDPVPARIHELMDECFNILQVPDFPDAENYEMVPFPPMPVLQMPFDSTE